jgi:hypothetical protein
LPYTYSKEIRLYKKGEKMKKIISLRDLAGFKPETLEQIKNISFYTDKSLFFGTLKVFCDVQNKNWFSSLLAEFNDAIYKQVTIYHNIKKNELGNIKFNLYMGEYMYYTYTMALRPMMEMTKFVKEYKSYFSNTECSPTLYFNTDVANDIYLEYEMKDANKELAHTKFIKEED